MDSKAQKLVEDGAIKSQAAFTSALNLSAVPYVDVSSIQSHYEKCFPQYSVNETNCLEFYISPSSVFYTQLNDTYLYLRLRIVDEKNDVVASSSTTCPVNGIFSALFSSMDIQINNVSLSGGSNMYAYSSHIQRLLSSDLDSLNTKMVTECYFGETSETDVLATSGTYKALHQLQKDAVFETYSKIYHGLFNCERLIAPQTAIRIRFRIGNPNFYLLGTDPSTSTTFKHRIQISDAFLDLKRHVINSRIMSMHETLFNKGSAFKYPYLDFDAMSFSITSGTLTFTSENLFSSVPEILVLGLVDSKSFNGLPSLSPFRFKPYDLASACALVDGESISLSDPKMNVAEKMIMRQYRHLVNIKSNQGGSNAITLDEFKRFGCFLLPLLNNNSGRSDRFSIEKTANVKIQLQFKTSTLSNINAIVFYAYPKILSVSKTQVFIS